MASVTVTRHSQVTIPKEIREIVGISEGDQVNMKVVEGNKIVIEKADAEVWSDCTDFLPEDFEKIVSATRLDSINRFKRLGLTP
ncbi:MAG: AbrB/MazE/SpoVT family DNA-binding domain-containing protein [Candidatus Bathyarchaeota archaeon]|nr:AbrB/MazE/SpoVT family DNA-binding domain-containing protein [Candidatus Termiticorpusculum sp.]MCL2867864.1 AbrB/MazE/SpoVT family DNA-binding domain-containing protein [Candidatus Termiticorpusculum sp.]